ncbi:zinc finger MYND domain-containing protein 11 [Nilaparvata lugens]|uniref:zinc finger MYND domain-containing protein 11 n=1 Tax=Nilaparvata lugens TaxID=108931 RepID=UPI00193DE4B6|nr:zinc finger MYND domain-containing protein 11 [Nilaparvata lugens]
MKMNKKLFYAMSRRRVSDPQITQQLWDAIKTIRYQRQVPDIDRIAKYMLKTYNVNHEEVVRQLGYCVRDGLLEQVKRKGFKGSKVGVEQEGYKLPSETMKKDKKDSHDWYCFECHHGGDVISCNSCHRVYHLACIAKEELPETDVKHKFKCNVCKMCEERDQSFEIKKSQLNRLLRCTCNHMKQRMPGCITDRPTVPIVTPHVTDRWASATPRRSASEVPNSFKWVTDDKDEWRTDYLIHRYMDLPMMQSKAESGKYEYLEEFKADAQTVVHNVVILHGVHSIKADEARLMLRDCLHDLQEIRQCRDCYRYSCDKTNRHWFCKPCKPPHTLVYAKQKGSAYWPAKVIKIDGDSYDVRFFGGQHEHVVVDKAYIRPISVNIHTLQVKKSSAWNKACEELKKHQKLLDKLRQITNNFTLPAPESSSSSEDDDEEEEKQVKKVIKKEVVAEAEDEKSQSCSEESSTLTSPPSTASAAKGKKKNAKNSKTAPSVADEESSPSPKRKVRQKRSVEVAPVKIEQEECSIASEDAISTPENDEKATTPQHTPSGLRKRGRPPGSKNKTPTKKILLEEEPKSKKPKKTTKSKKKASKDDDSKDSSEEEDEEADDEEDDEDDEDDDDDDDDSSSKDVKEEKEDLEPMELTEEMKNEDNTEDGEDEENSKDELGPPQLQHGPSSKKESPISSTTLSPPHLVKKEDEELEMVSSSSQEPQVRSVAIQAKISDKKSQEKPSKELISRKQWCYNCEAEAIYHCCWNTAYCSTECQQLHWQKEHKRVCRRKR